MNRQGDYILELSKTLHIFLNSLGNLKEKKVVVGFSGGADSTVLLDLLYDRKKHFNFKLEAVFFSHGSSPIAVDEDIMKIFCKDFCKERNILLNICDLDLEKIPRQGWESSGRKARQNFYRNYECDWIFLGHHKNDQNETTMTQLFRGGGKGTIAMQFVEGKYCRPFLNHFKTEIYEYLKEKKINWIEDPTNTQTEFTRNFWRNIGIPSIEQHYPNYSSSLDKFRKKQEDLYSIANEMAIEDGLNLFIKKEPVDLKNISAVRLKNLLVHIFNHYSKSMEDGYYEQQVNHYFSNKNLEIDKKGIVLSISKNTMNNYIAEENNKLRFK